MGSSSSSCHLPVICRPCLPLSGPGSSLSEPAVPSGRKLGHPKLRSYILTVESLESAGRGAWEGVFFWTPHSRGVGVCVYACVQFFTLPLSTSVCFLSAFLHLSTSGFLFVPFSLALFLCFFFHICVFCSLYYSCRFHAYSL